MPRKPAGVIVSAILLILLSLFMLFGAAVSVATAAAFKGNPGLTVTAPGAVPPTATMMVVMMGVGALFNLALATWGLTTSIGLFRMKNWARISAMIIGGLVAAFGLFLAAICSMIPAFMKGQALPSNVNPATLTAVFIAFAAICLFIAAIGIWWIVYFALRRTRQAFAPATPPIPTSTLAYSHPLTDFTVAQPLNSPAQPLESQTSWPQPSQPWPQPAQQAQTDTPHKRPVSMLILGILLMLGSAMGLAQMFSPFPLFFFGLILSGMSAHIAMFCYGVLLAYCGLGLLKLQKPAWATTLAFFVLGLLNTLAMLLPAYRTRLVSYTLSVTSEMQAALPTQATAHNPGLDPHFLSVMLVPAAVFGAVLIIFLIVLLFRARPAFESPAAETAAQP